MSERNDIQEATPLSEGKTSEHNTPYEGEGGATPQPDDQEVTVRNFFTMKNLKIAQVNIIASTLNGYSIGFVGVYSTLYDMSTNCDKYKAKNACNTLSNVHCIWRDAAEPYCTWKHHTSCMQDFTNKDTCGRDKDCRWNYGDKNCQNIHGYSTFRSGVFAGSMILGCMIGSIFGGFVATRLGPKRSFLLVGVVACIASALYHVATATDLFWLLCSFRVVIGLVLGLVCVAAPMYVAMNAEPRFSKMIGVTFQVFTTFGIFLAASMGLLMGQTVKYSSNTDQHLSGRMQGLCAVSSLLSFFVVLLGLFLGGNTEVSAKQSEMEGMDDMDQNEYSWASMTIPLFLGAIVAGTLQLTGINAVMNYAPTIMDSLGMAPLVGNFVVMVWNFVTTFASIVIARYVSMRNMFLGGSLIASVACLLLCGIPVYPDVADKNVKDGVAITGIFIFIAAFEIGVGPCFYVLSQDLFPPSFRPKGSSFTMVIQFIFNLIINVFYPTATKAISGGDSGNQDKGQSVAFIFFGSIGLCCFIIQLFFLFPWDDGKTNDAAAAEKANAVANEDSVNEPANEAEELQEE